MMTSPFGDTPTNQKPQSSPFGDSPVDQPQQNEQPEPAWYDKAIGTLENIRSIGGGMLTEPVAGLAGLAAAAIPGGKTGAEMVETVQQAGQEFFKPETEAGKQQQQSIGEFLQPVGEVLQNISQGAGDYVYEKTGSPLLGSLATASPDLALTLIGSKPVAKAARNYQTATKNAIAEVLKKSPQSKLAGKYMIDAAGNISKSKAFANATSQGFDEATMAAFKGSSKADKARMAAMIKRLEEGLNDATVAVTKRPSDVVGQSALQRVNFLKKVNRQAARELEGAASSLKGKSVDLDGAVNDFMSDLQSMGVRLDRRNRPIFKGSDIEGATAAQNFIAKLIKRMRDTKAPDAYDAHRLKKFIDEQVVYGKAGEGLSGRAEAIAKSLRRNIDSTLDDSFPAYNSANTKYADTIGALDSLQSGIGKIDLFSDNADAAIGTALRRVMSNTQARAKIIGAIDNLDSTAAKYGAKFDDDLITQTLFADELDSMFNLQNRTTFKGQAARGIRQAAQGSQGLFEATVDKAGELVDKARGFDDKSRIKALRDLLSEGNQ